MYIFPNFFCMFNKTELMRMRTGNKRLYIQEDGALTTLSNSCGGGNQGLETTARGLSGVRLRIGVKGARPTYAYI